MWSIKLTMAGALCDPGTPLPISAPPQGEMVHDLTSDLGTPLTNQAP